MFQHRKPAPIQPEGTTRPGEGAPPPQASAPPPTDAPTPTRVGKFEDIAGPARELFAKFKAAKEAAKAEAAAPAPEPGAPSAPPQGGAPPPSASPAAPAPKQPAPADPALLQAVQSLLSDRAKVDADKEALKPQAERAKALESAAEELKQGGGLPALRRLIQTMGVEQADDIVEELLDEYTLQTLKIEPDSGTKAQRETRRLRRQLAEAEKQRAEADRRRTEEEEARQRRAQERAAVEEIGRHFESQTETFPHLASIRGSKEFRSPEELIWGEIVSHWNQTGQELSLDDAAKRAETKLERLVTPFRGLYAPAANADPETPQQQQAQSRQAPITLSSGMASAPSGAPSRFGTYIEDDELSKRTAIEWARAQFAARRETEGLE